MTDYPKANLEKIMVALDHEDPDKAMQLVEELGELISWYKIGPSLFTRDGHNMVEFLHRKGKKLFLDLKIHDIPVVVAATIRQIADLGALYTTVHCMGGKEMLEAAGEACRGSRLKLLGVTALTSQASTTGAVLDYVKIALETRLAGVLSSPQETAAVRQNTPPGFILVSAGVRIPGDEVFRDDQKRVASPREALEAGNDYLIVGRPISLAREPREVVMRLFEK